MDDVMLMDPFSPEDEVQGGARELRAMWYFVIFAERLTQSPRFDSWPGTRNNNKPVWCSGDIL